MVALAVGRLSRGIAGVAAAATLLLAGAACGERSEPTGPQASLYPVTVPGTGDRPLVLARPVTRIAVFGPGIEETLDALGAGAAVAGSPVDARGAIEVAKLRRLRPDLIVASPGFDQGEVSRAARAVRTPVYLVPEDSIRDVERAYTQLGLITGHPDQARDLVEAVEAKRAEVAGTIRGRPRVTVFVDTGFFTTIGSQSLGGDLIREARGIAVGGESPGGVELAKLVTADPRLYLVTDDSGTVLADLRKNRVTRRLTAVRTGRFRTIPASYLHIAPRLGDTLEAFARLLHPDAFR